VPSNRTLLTSEVLRLLQRSNPDQSVTEHRVRSVIRRGAIQTPRILSGCYFWTWDEIRRLADVLNLRVSRSASLQQAGEGERDERD